MGDTQDTLVLRKKLPFLWTDTAQCPGSWLGQGRVGCISAPACRLSWALGHAHLHDHVGYTLDFEHTVSPIWSIVLLAKLAKSYPSFVPRSDVTSSFQNQAPLAHRHLSCLPPLSGFLSWLQSVDVSHTGDDGAALTLEQWFSTGGNFDPQGKVWPCLETRSIVTTKPGSRLLAFSG